MKVQTISEIKEIYKWMKNLNVGSFHIWVPDEKYKTLLKQIEKAKIGYYINGSFAEDILGIHLTIN
jgi:sulfopyruvate decarboxylase TPP-binding subunit